MTEQLHAYTLTLSLGEIEVLGNALGEMPFKIAAPLIQNIRAQMAEQEQKKDA